MVIDALVAAREERDIGIAYIYLDYAEKEAQTPENVFASILKQVVLCKEKEGIVKLRRLYDACNKSTQTPDADTILRFITCALYKTTTANAATEKYARTSAIRVLINCEQVRKIHDPALVTSSSHGTPARNHGIIKVSRIACV